MFSQHLIVGFLSVWLPLMFHCLSIKAKAFAKRLNKGLVQLECE